MSERSPVGADRALLDVGPLERRVHVGLDRVEEGVDVLGATDPVPPMRNENVRVRLPCVPDWEPWSATTSPLAVGVNVVPRAGALSVSITGSRRPNWADSPAQAPETNEPCAVR